MQEQGVALTSAPLLLQVVKMDWSQSNFQPEAIFVTVGQNDFRDTKWVTCSLLEHWP
jgi:hypothetical protein